jgi:hypothetical protein
VNILANFVEQHYFVLACGTYYVLSAMVNALPDPPQKFDFYPWIVHVTRSLLNSVPPQYKKLEEKKL